MVDGGPSIDSNATVGPCGVAAAIAPCGAVAIGPCGAAAIGACGPVEQAATDRPRSAAANAPAPARLNGLGCAPTARGFPSIPIHHPDGRQPYELALACPVIHERY